MSSATQLRDELVALALGEPADGLRRGDPALVEDPFVLTRPYFGTAISMSITLAVRTYSGGSMSSVWILTLFAFRSRFSWARFERMSFARLSASILWSSDLSGAALEDWTGACIGAAVYPRPHRAERGTGRL